MKKILVAIGQFILTIFWFAYAVLIKTPLNALKCRKAEQEKIYLEIPVPDDYRIAVTRFADYSINQRFLNDSNGHAIIVAGLMITRAPETDEVLIYSRSLEPVFYKEILCGLKSRARILLDNRVGGEVIKTLPLGVQNRIDFRIATLPYGPHFLVTKYAFRCEAEDHKDELFVLCNFNEPDIVLGLKDRFEKIWENSTPTPLF